MATIIINDSQGTRLAVDLRDILRVLGQQADEAIWELSYVEANGPSAEELHRLDETHTRVSGTTLRHLAEDLIQAIDGDFAAYRASDEKPWIIVRAVDSTYFSVESDDETVIEKIRASFKDTQMID